MNKTKNKPYTLTPESFLNRGERKRLIHVCKDRSDDDLLHGRITWPVRWMLVDLALYSGLRVGEIAALKVEDLYLNDNDPYLIVRSGKGRKTRTVYFDLKLSEHLKWFIDFKNYGLLQSNKPGSALFTGRNGGHCPVITLEKSFKKAASEAGLPSRYSIHSLRHTYATYLLNDTGNLRYVQKQLGHSSIVMTSLYANILPEMNGALANKISRDE